MKRSGGEAKEGTGLTDGAEAAGYHTLSAGEGIKVVKVVDDENHWFHRVTRPIARFFRWTGLISEPTTVALTRGGAVARETPQFSPRAINLLYRVSNLTLLLLAFKFIDTTEAQSHIEALFETIGASASEQAYLRSLTGPFLQFFADSLASSSLTLHEMIASGEGTALIVSTFIARGIAAGMEGFNDASAALVSRGQDTQSLFAVHCRNAPLRISRPIVSGIAFSFFVWLVDQFTNEASMQETIAMHPAGQNATCHWEEFSVWSRDLTSTFCAGSMKLGATTGFLSVALKGGIAYATIALGDAAISIGVSQYIQWKLKREPRTHRQTMSMTVTFDPRHVSPAAIHRALHALTSAPEGVRSGRAPLRVIADHAHAGADMDALAGTYRHNGKPHRDGKPARGRGRVARSRSQGHLGASVLNPLVARGGFGDGGTDGHDVEAGRETVNPLGAAIHTPGEGKAREGDADQRVIPGASGQ